MDKAVNALSVQVYVRQRAQTIVTDVAGQSSGSIALDLARPSDVTVIVVSDYFAGTPALLVGAVGRAPSASDFDIIISPVDEHYVKAQSRVTLHLPEGSTTFRWKGLGTDGSEESFSIGCAKVVLAVDQ